jgi:glycosyltransferase involved in cell wall biosynthesis
MRIAVVGGIPPNREGEAHYAGCVYRALAEQFSDPLIVYAHVQRDTPRTASILPHYTVQRVTHGYHRLKRHFVPLYLWRELRRFRPHVVHFQAPHKGLYGGIYGEPLLLLFRYLRLHRIPTVVTMHSLWLHEDFNEMATERGHSPQKRALLESLYQRYCRSLLTVASHVNALVAGERNPLIQEFQQEWELPEREIYAEAHPCEIFESPLSNIANAKAPIGLENKRFIFAFGFVRPDKGFHYLMEAVAPMIERDPTLQLVIAGQPRGSLGQQYAHQLQEMYVQMGKPPQIRLEFGYLPDERMHSYLRSCDVLVVPYTRVMGASGPMHHALSYGKPVVATNIGQNRGLSDICALVPPRDPEALRHALQQILYDRSCWEQYHQRAVHYAATHTWRHLALNYHQIYQQLIDEGGRLI